MLSIYTKISINIVSHGQNKLLVDKYCYLSLRQMKAFIIENNIEIRKFTVHKIECRVI